MLIGFKLKEIKPPNIIKLRMIPKNTHKINQYINTKHYVNRKGGRGTDLPVIRLKKGL